MHGRLARAGKDAAQPFAGFVHRGARFVDDADPEHKAVIDTKITSRSSGYAGGLQPVGVEFAFVAQRVVFGSDYEGGGKPIRSRARSGEAWGCALSASSFK